MNTVLWCALTAIWGVILGFHLGESSVENTVGITYEEARQLIEDCQKTLPRNEKCVFEMKTVVEGKVE